MSAVTTHPLGDAGDTEPVAWRYRWKLDGEWTNWRVADASQKSQHLRDLEEVPLFAHPAAEAQEVCETCGGKGRLYTDIPTSPCPRDDGLCPDCHPAGDTEPGDLVERLKKEATDLDAYHCYQSAVLMRAAEQRVVELERALAEVQTISRALRQCADNLAAEIKDEERRADTLSARVAALEGALTPFASLDMPAAEKWTCGTFLIEHSDIRSARALLKSEV